MLQISMDISSLTLVQRGALIRFILDFSAPEVVSSTSELSDEDLVELATTPEQAFSVSVVTPSEEPRVIPPPPSDFRSIPADLPAHMRSINQFPPPAVAAINEYGNGLDKNGLPWDERIHASSKAKVADGTWRQKRGVDTGLVATVEAELKALMGLPSPAGNGALVAPVPVARIETTVFPGSVGTLSDNGPLPSVLGVTEIPSPTMITANLVPPPPPAPSVQPIAKHCEAHDNWYLDACSRCAIPVHVPAPPAPAMDFMGLLTFASTNVQGKKVSIEEVTEIIQAAGVPNLPLLQNRPDLVPAIHASIVALIAGR